ncbi:hypothetical protein [Streptomyces sp. NPDC049881]|uniref:hypothetical protein n=1 Tax=Streptomyces sp. NPDC049881 TaxID=3155778 RepID=UPI003432A2EE
MAWDARILHAVGKELSSSPPFEAAEVRGITYLKVRHARTYEGVSECSGLQILLLVGSGSHELPLLEPLDRLTRLVISDSALRTVKGVGDCPSIRDLEIARNFLQDLSPLLACPHLRRVDVTGNPLSRASYEEVIPELTRRGVKVSAPTLQERDLMLRMQAIGLPFAYYQLGGSYRLCRPGLELTDMPEADHIKMSPQDVQDLLDHDPDSLRSIFRRTDLIPTLDSP